MNNLYNGLLKRGLFAPYIDGKPNGTYLAWHPLEVVSGKHGYNKKQYTNYEINAALQYDVPFIKGLSLKLSYNRYERHTFIKQFNRPYDLYVFETTGTNNHIQTDILKEVKTRNDGDFLYEKYNKDHSYQLNAMVTYNRTFGDHDISALFVYEQAESTNDWFTGQRNYFISSAVDQLFAGSSDAKDSSVDGSGSESGRLSYIGRIGYTYANKYMLDFLRRKIKIAPDRFYYALADYGNTVSNTIPIALHDAKQDETIKQDMMIMVAGFGVGYSWGATILHIVE